MIVRLDGQQLVGDFKPEHVLQTLVDQVRREQLPERIVVAVSIDGRPLVDPELSDRLSQPIGDVEQIEFESSDAGELSVAALREVADQLSLARDSLEEIGRVLKNGDSDQAIEGFCGFLGAWRNSQRAIGQCGQLLQRDLTAEHFEDRSLEEHLGELSETLREMRDAFEARDTVLLSDLVEYEMPSLCDRWSEMLGELAQRLGPDAR